MFRVKLTDDEIHSKALGLFWVDLFGFAIRWMMMLLRPPDHITIHHCQALHIPARSIIVANEHAVRESETER